MAQRIPLPLTVSCFSKIPTGFAFLVPAHPGSPGQRAVKGVCVCVCVTTAGLLLLRVAGQRDLVSCFIPLLKPTLACTEAFDRYFRHYVAEKQYRNACR